MISETLMRGWFVFCLFVVLVLILSPGCSLQSKEAGNEGELLMVLELIRDPHFQQGIKLYSPDRSNVRVVDILDFGSETVQPVWEMRQWWNSISLEGEELQEFMPGVVGYENEGAKVMVGSPGHEYEGITLRLNGGAQYNYEPLVIDSNFTWPHLTVGQRLTPGHPENHNVSIAKMEKIIFTRKARLLDLVKFQEDIKGQTTHYVCFITIQNLNRESPGFGDHFGFGVKVYDLRYEYFPGNAFHDQGNETKPGTGKFIYNPPQNQQTDGTLHSGEWVEWNFDMLPFILEGFQLAWDRGFLKDSHDLNDYYLGGYSMGWETPGLYDAEIQVKDLSIKAIYRGY